jgi:hypothetical protein
MKRTFCSSTLFRQHLFSFLSNKESHYLIINMSKLMFVVLILIGLTCSAWASLNLHGQPLLAGATSFTLEIETVNATKPTTCYTTSGQVTQCRRKRGMEEKPMQFLEGELKIVPSAVIG